MEESLSLLGIVKKRIKYETGSLVKQNICDENNIKIGKYNDVNYFIEFKNLLDNNNYKFIISDCYPFVPPKVFINKKYILHYYKITNRYFNILLKKYTEMDCFCCNTILCSNNWKPTYKFIHILDEFNEYIDMRHQIIIRIFVDVIKNKYLTYDINIIEWLY